MKGRFQANISRYDKPWVLYEIFALLGTYPACTSLIRIIRWITENCQRMSEGLDRTEILLAFVRKPSSLSSILKIEASWRRINLYLIFGDFDIWYGMRSFKSVPSGGAYGYFKIQE